MYIGKLKTRIQIQEYTQTPDGGGGWTKAWATIATVRAAWKHQSMFERLQAQQLEAGVSHRITIRKRDGITAKHRILYKGQAYQIVGVVDVAESNREMELQVTEGVAT